MWKCMRCGKENSDLVIKCVTCGHEKFMNYIQYPVLTRLLSKTKNNWIKQCNVDISGEGKVYLIKAAEIFQNTGWNDINQKIQDVIVCIDEKRKKDDEQTENTKKPLMMSDASEVVVLGGTILRKNIQEIEFVQIKDDQIPIGAWNVSEDKKGEIWAWNEVVNKKIKLYIGSRNGVYANTNCSDFFKKYVNLTKIQFNGLFDTCKVTNMSGMFSYCTSLENIDLESFDTENVTDMSEMFFGCTGLREINLKKFNTETVEDMSCMFCNCQNLRILDISSFVTINVKKMRSMFLHCEKLENLKIAKFNMKKLIDTSYMFGGCKKIKSSDVFYFYNAVKDNKNIVKDFMYDGCNFFYSK